MTASDPQRVPDDERASDVRERTAPPAAVLPPAQARLLALQRGAGNAAVARTMLARETAGQMAEQGARALAGGGMSLALTAYVVKNKAWTNAWEHTGGVGNHLGPTDACRHCGWSAMIMLAALGEDRYSLLPSVFGTPAEQTWKVVMAHEHAVGGAGTKDSKMDQHNNRAGIDMAQRLFNGNKDVTRDEIAAAARQELDRGGLVLFDKGGTMISSANWRAMDRDTWDPGKYLDTNANPVPQPAATPAS
jgi:hypothetical protein